MQRTWLDPRRPAKAGGGVPGKALKRIHGLAVRFGAPDGLAPLVGDQGIETVLSLVTAVPEFRASAALSPGSLGALTAERLARRCARAGVAAPIVVPAGNDFNDDLVALGASALGAHLAPLFRRAARKGGRSDRQAELDCGGTP